MTASKQAVKTGAAIEIKRADGRRLFMGPIQANKPVALDVVLPTNDKRVEVTLKSGGTDRTTMIAIDGDEGSATFE